MKIGELAELLEKPAEELSTAYKVENVDDELNSEIVKKALQDHTLFKL